MIPFEGPTECCGESSAVHAQANLGAHSHADFVSVGVGFGWKRVP